MPNNILGLFRLGYQNQNTVEVKPLQTTESHLNM